MRYRYQTGEKTRELILAKIKAHGRPVDISTLVTLSGLKRSTINYTVRVLCGMEILVVHHHDRCAQGNQKPFYWLSSAPAQKRLIRLMH